MKTKLAIFDFDGTLTASKIGGNCWRYIWERINATDLDDIYYNAYKRGEIDYTTWAEKVGEVFNEYKVNRDLVEEVSNKIKVRDGIDTLFAFLKDNGSKTYVLSGGIKSMVNHALKPVLNLVDHVEAEDFDYDSEGIVKSVKTLDHDIGNKSEFIIRLLKQYKLAPNQAVFIGNGRNDEKAKKSGVKTICINPDDTDPHDKTIWDCYVEDIQNLNEIIPFID